MFYDTNHKNVIESKAQSNGHQIHLKKNWRDFLNFIFSEASHEELTQFFGNICLIQKNNFNITPKINQWFETNLLSLIHFRQTENFYIDFDSFLVNMNAEFLLKIHKSKTGISLDLKNRILNSLNSLDGFDVNQDKQGKNYLTSVNLINQQIVNIFLNVSNVEMDQDFVSFCDLIINKYQIKNLDKSTHILANIIYDGKITPENKDFLKTIPQRKIENLFSKNSPLICDNLILAISSKSVEKFKAALDDYINYYLSHEKNENILQANEQIKRDISSFLTMDDKIRLFYSPYFKKINSNYDTFFSLLLTNFNEKIFQHILDTYQIPVNCPIRVEKDILQTEERDDKIYKKIIKKSFYYNLADYCVEHSLFQVAQKIVKKHGAFLFKDFDKKIIENDVIYHYSSIFLKTRFITNQNYLELLIKNNLVNEKSFLSYKDSNDVLCYENIIFYLIQQQNYLLIDYLFKNSKDFDFSITTTQFNDNLLTYFLRVLFENLENKKSISDYSLFCSLLIERNFSLNYKNNKNETPKDFLKAISALNIDHLFCFLEKISPLVPENWSTKINKYSFSYESSNISEFDLNEKFENTEKDNVVWFNRAKLEKHFEKISQQKDSSNSHLINTMLQDSNHIRKNLFVEDENIFTKMSEDFPNFQEVIDFYKGQFRIKKLTKKINVQPILLLGAPGIGKTYFAQQMAEYLNTGYTFLDFGSMTAKWILAGANGTWKDAKQGKILDSIINSKTINPVVVMDELDKARGGDYDPTVVLYQLLEEINAKEFTDEFIDFSFNSSGIIYIACANDAYKLSDPLLSRFKTFEINLPSDEQFHKIIHNIYKQIIINTEIFSPTLSENVIKVLKGKSMRNIKSNLQDAVNKAIIEIDLKTIDKIKKDKQFITLTPEHLSSIYEKPTIGF